MTKGVASIATSNWPGRRALAMWFECSNANYLQAKILQRNRLLMVLGSATSDIADLNYKIK